MKIVLIFLVSAFFQPLEVIAAVEKCLQEFGRLDIVVNGEYYVVMSPA